MKIASAFPGGIWIQGRLPAGPHGASFLAARSSRARRPLWVVKPLLRGDPGTSTAEFRHDFRDLLSLKQPALALPTRIIRAPDSERAFLLRPYIAGSDILAARTGRSLKRALSWMLSAAEALGILHRFGFLHRNVRASNIIVPRSAFSAGSRGGPRIILCDPAWWSEERESGSADGSRQASPASDLRALGKVFYSLLTGRDPEVSGGVLPAPPSRHCQELSLDIDRLVLRLLHPDPGMSYQKVRDLAADLRLLGAESPDPGAAQTECFLDRGDELKRARCLLEGRRRGTALAISGEAGSGKSAFLDRLAIEAQVLGFRTVHLECSGKSSPVPALRRLTAGLMPSGTSPSSTRMPIRRLLQELSGAAGISSGRRRSRIIAELAEAVAATASDQPTLLLADDLHLAVPILLEFLGALAARIAPVAPGARSQGARPFIIAVSHRIESQCADRVRHLMGGLERIAKGMVLMELAPLSWETVEDWLELALLDRPEVREKIRSGAASSGNPGAIYRAIGEAVRERRRPGVKPAPGSHASLDLDFFRSLGDEERGLLEILSILEKPASLDVLAGALGFPRPALDAARDSLIRKGSLAVEGDLLSFRHRSFEDSIRERLGMEEKKVLHRIAAAAIESRHPGSFEEIARHWLRSDTPQRGIAAALEAARELARNHEDRRALELYRSVLDLLSEGDRPHRLTIAMEAAEAYGRIGEYGRAAETLEGILRDLEDGPESGQVHGRLGTFHHRAGNAGRGVEHLEKGLALLAGIPGEGRLRQRLHIQSELAEIASNRNDFARAEETCCRALEEIRLGGPIAADPEIRRAEMVLLETLGHLALRRFRYDEARQSFESSLRISEELGTAPETGLILNNLGILHIQENRFPKAIDCYRRAEAISVRLGEDQTLANVLSNLAVLHAKMGEPEAADQALQRAAYHDSRCDSRRVHFLQLHAAGMVDHILGRYAGAITAFREAITLGIELADQFLVAFDRIYLGECYLFQGAARAARGAFESCLEVSAGAPQPIRPMAQARLACLAALRGDRRAARAYCDAYGEPPAGGIPYLLAWDRIFLGWTQRLLGDLEATVRLLEAPRAFFAGIGVPAGEIHAALEIAACEIAGGDPARARKRLIGLRARHSPGRGALRNPMLAARLLAYQALAEIERDDPDPEEASSLLAHAESFLIGRGLRDLEELAGGLRRRIGSPTAAAAPRPAAAPGDTQDGIAGRAGGEGPAVPAAVSSILGKSPAVRDLIQLIRRIAPAPLPVLITGETGTGKELAARALHEESARRRMRFVSIDCAALPGELLEAELFGYRRGAFSGAERDHTGLLLAADGGTVLFDEIGEMPAALQAKILRFLDSGRFRPLGGIEEVRVDARALFITSRDLGALAEEDRFRMDLLHRLRVLELRVPPLRERAGDIPLLVERFRRLAAKESAGDPALSWRLGEGTTVFSEEAMRALSEYSWPGNVRELRNVVTRLALERSGEIRAGDIQAVLSRDSTAGLFTETVLRSHPIGELTVRLEREHLLLLHADCNGDIEAMASRLGISVRGLYKRFRRLGIDPRRLQ